MSCVCLVKSFVLLLAFQMFETAPSLQSKTWPSMKSYDIWDSDDEIDSIRESENQVNAEENVDNFGNSRPHVDFGKRSKAINTRQNRVLNFFPTPVDGECLSEDGRRLGICLNVYECRMQGGTSRGECGLGFGVCCVFIAECGQEVKNNLTYVVSPSFPNFMPINMTSCRIKVKIIDKDISQLRMDFNHFMLGQPNRKTGICDGDVFSVSGGLGGTLKLCGQNSGQHVYYEVGGEIRPKKSRQATSQFPTSVNSNMLSATMGSSSQIASSSLLGNSSSIVPASMTTTAESGRDFIEILMNFTKSSLVSTRLWEIRVAQIPFSQRAPAGCLQYFNGLQGIIQTFNFADNGRHLANQDYRACIRQEIGMCSITYEPCDEQSFRIGPNSIDSSSTGAAASTTMPTSDTMANVMNDIPVNCSATETVQMSSTETTTMTPTTTPNSTVSNQLRPFTNATQMPSSTPASNQTEDIEGSGGGENDTTIASPPIRGGFNIYGFFRNIFDFSRSSKNRRTGRQFISTCTDRITIPCIVEDFIGNGIGPLLGCEPVHCGSRFCSSSGFCRVESTVTPFRVGIHFGSGIGKGNPEENIGMCLKYNQLKCM